MAVLTASSNIPMTFYDCLSPTINKLLPDYKIDSKYHSALTKATYMVNLAVAPVLIKNLIEQMRDHPYSIS